MQRYIDIFFIVGPVVLFMYFILKHELKIIRKELKEIKEMQKKADERIAERMDKREQRIDHLYEIAVEMLKTRR